MSRRRRTRKEELLDAVDLDLKPFMNLFVVLIPFLLACAQFAKIALVDIKLPETSDEVVQVKDKADEEGLNLTIIISDKAITLGAKGGFLPQIQYREFHTYSSLSDKAEFVHEYDPKKSQEEVFSPTDKKKMTPYERMVIKLTACVRESEDDKGVIQKAYHNKFKQAVTNEAGRLLTEPPQAGARIYLLPLREPEIVRDPAEYYLDSLSAYDKLAADLLLIRARYQGQGMADEQNIIIAAEDEIAYDKIIQIIDICRETGFPNVSIAKMRG